MLTTLILIEKLSFLSEEAFHRALKYARNVNFFGVCKIEEYLNLLKRLGFWVLKYRIIDLGKRFSGEKFLKIGEEDFASTRRD